MAPVNISGSLQHKCQLTLSPHSSCVYMMVETVDSDLMLSEFDCIENTLRQMLPRRRLKQGSSSAPDMKRTFGDKDNSVRSAPPPACNLFQLRCVKTNFHRGLSDVCLNSLFEYKGAHTGRASSGPTLQNITPTFRQKLQHKLMHLFRRTLIPSSNCCEDK